MSTGRREALKTVAWGVAWVVGAVAFWLWAVGNPIDDLRLTLSAQVAPGQITDSLEDAEDGDDGRLRWFHTVAYRFTLPNGREIKLSTSGTGRLRPELVDLTQPVPIEVEYDPRSPSINRIKGDGSQSVTEWLLRKVGVGGLFMVLLLSPGVKLIRDGVAEFRASS